jgi:ABC-2 type transport system ATP-binding protein
MVEKKTISVEKNNMVEIAVEIKDLVKDYSSKGRVTKRALSGINLTIPKGSFFGLLGPNGAGKSTLINILSGLVIKTSGDVLIDGYNIATHERQAKQAIGVVPQELVLDSFFTVRQALDMHAGYYGVAKSERKTQEIIEAMGLKDKADAKSRSLSGGMRRRLLIGKALVHNPKVLVLDEPTAGVDIELRTQLWEYVKKLNKLGTTILLTTHYLEEAQQLCDEIAIINHGSVVACDSKNNLMAGFDNKQLIVKLAEKIDELPSELSLSGWVLLDNNHLKINYKPTEANIENILQILHQFGYSISDLSTKDTELEEVFRHFTAS